MKSSKWLWGGVALVFVFMACAWTAMFFFAGKAEVRSVPLAGGGGEAPPSRSAESQIQPGGPALPEEAR